MYTFVASVIVCDLNTQVMQAENCRVQNMMSCCTASWQRASFAYQRIIFICDADTRTCENVLQVSQIKRISELSQVKKLVASQQWRTTNNDVDQAWKETA